MWNAISSSKLLWSVEQERKRKIHEQRLLAINSRKPRRKKSNKPKTSAERHLIDNFLAKGSYKHIKENKKRQYYLERERIEVKRINRLLLGKLQQVFASESPFDEVEPQYVKPRSLNINERRKELMRINEENKSMLRRLQSVEPTMSAKQLADEEKIRRKDRKRLQCFIPTLDIFIHSTAIAKESSVRSETKAVAATAAGTGTKGEKKSLPVPPNKKQARPRRNKPKTKGRTITDSVLQSNAVVTDDPTKDPQQEQAQETQNNQKKRQQQQEQENDAQRQQQEEQAQEQQEQQKQQEQRQRQAITNIIQLVAGVGATTMTYKQLLKSLVSNANNIHQECNTNGLSFLVNIKQCTALFYNRQSIGYEELVPVLSLEPENQSDVNEHHFNFQSDAQIVFAMIDTDKDGVITYNELLVAIQESNAVQQHCQNNNAVSPLLDIARIKGAMKSVAGVVNNEEQMNFNSFLLLISAVVQDMDVMMDSKDTSSLEAIDQLFVLLDTNKDGILSYRECFDGMSLDSVQDLINNKTLASKLKDLLHPSKLKTTLNKISKHHPSNELNRNAFRLWVAVTSNNNEEE
tara:strand:+ start:34 stop:1761 length:1728 start_codon:yes stop_codon:yes gene_type:complete